MVRQRHEHSPERVAILRWTAGLGAVTAEALAQRQRSTVASARALLLAAERAGQVVRRRVLVGEPTLYAITPAGLRASGLRGLQPCRISPANARHTIVCARVAAALELAYPDQRVSGERELRCEERRCGGALASARVGQGPGGEPMLHRPDLVLWPAQQPQGLPVAVEVELTVKAPRRLFQICTAWARCRSIAGTLYLVAPEVRAPLERAIETAAADGRIVAVELDALM